MTVVGPGVRTTIVIADDWEKGTWYDFGGHAILRRYAELITGIKVPVISAGKLVGMGVEQPYDVRIWVGRQPETERVLEDTLAALDDDGYVIRTTANNVYLAGKFWWGDNWAAHDLLERFAGCRWYLMEPRFWDPKHDGYYGPGDIIPKADAIQLPTDTTIVEEPDYESRWFRIVPFHSFRVRRRDQFHHYLRSVLPPDKLFDEHPGWYPEIDGERYRPKSANDFQPCVSNEGLRDFVVAHILEHFRQHPEASSFSLGMNDTHRFCECGACLDAAPESVVGKHARIAWGFFDFYNKVADRVVEVYPDKRLGCLAYSRLRSVPEGSIKLHPSVVPYLTIDSAQLHEPAQQQEFEAAVKKWRGISHQMGIYEYIYGGGFVVPRIYSRYLLPNLKRRYGAGVTGFYAEAYPNWGLDGPKYWLVSKLLWDISLDPEKLLAQFYNDMFGSAGDAMKAYFEFLEATWCTQTLESSRSNFRWLRDPTQLEIFPSDVCDRAMRLIEEAQGQAPDDAVRKRIAFFKTSFALTRTLSGRYASARAADDLARPEPMDPVAVLRAVDRWLKSGNLDLAKQEVHALGFGAFSTTYPYTIDSVDLYARTLNIAVERLVYAVTRAAITGETFQTAAEVRNAIDQEVDLLASQAGKDRAMDALELIRSLSRDRGTVFVRTVDTAPKCEGSLDAKEWGEAAFSGAFYPHRNVRGKSDSILDRRVPEKTTMWAVRHGEAMYLAFAMEQDPATLGAKVTERDTTHWRAADMSKDDAVAISFVPRSGGAQHVRINVNTAIADYQRSDSAWDVTEGQVRRVADGWQVELKLDLTKMWINPASRSPRLTKMPVSRYTRRPVPKKKGEFRTESSTLLPFAFGKGVIFHGNHPGLMSFVTGPYVIFERVPVAGK